MAIGKVKWFNYDKGFGFIKPDNNSDRDVFVHISALKEAGIADLKEGAHISYEVATQKGKESAVNLKLLNA